MIEIETGRLLLRWWRDEDLEPYARLCDDPEVMRFIGDGSTLTREQSGDQISRFVRHRQERGFGLWAAEKRATGAFVGFAGLAHQEDWPKANTRPRSGGGWIAPSGDKVSLPRRRRPAWLTGSRRSGWLG
ncbi:hypothetical protein BH24ACT18_BH24ACT18_10390 [soil metagenome]